MDDVATKIREIISVELRIDEAQVSSSARLRSDLGMDSVSALNILFAAEEAFGIEGIEVTEIATVTTVADVESLVRRYVSGPAS
jgi:acyl carrier protein